MARSPEKAMAAKARGEAIQTPEQLDDFPITVGTRWSVITRFSQSA